MSGVPAGPRRPTGWRILLAAAAAYALFAVVYIGVFRAERSSDFRDFWENAQHFRATGQIAADLGVHNYLPVFTIFMLPWSFMPLPVAAGVFVLLSLALFALGVVMAETLLNERLGRQPRAALLGAILLILPYVVSCATLGNLGLLLAFLLVTTWFFVERGREWEAGAALGLAITLKLMPLALLAFFVLKRRWRVAGAAVGVFVVLALGVPLAALGPEPTWRLHREFYERAIRGHAPVTTLTASQPVKTLYSNSALPMVIRRLLSPVDSSKAGSGPLRVNVATASPEVRVAVYGAVVAVLAGVTIYRTLRPRVAWPPADPEEGAVLRRQYAAWLCFMLLSSPLLWIHYLPMVYWALARVADRADRDRRAAGGRLTAAHAALALWAAAALLLAWPAARAAGVQLAGLLALWLVLVRLPRNATR